jgi:hypothetical protein
VILATVSKHAAAIQNLAIEWACFGLAAIVLLSLIFSEKWRHSYRWFPLGWKGAAIACCAIIALSAWLIFR